MMLSALLYLQYHSVRNRVAAQFKRWRQPKYLAGAIVGVLYFYYYFFRSFSYTHGEPTAGALPDNPALYETLGTLVLAIFALTAWIFPRDRASLAFTEAEVAFLFPAPVSRRTLIHFKLLRSQTAILFTTLFLALVSRRLGGGHFWIHAAAWWLVLSTLNLHFLGSSFARTILMDRGITNWTRRIVIFTAIFALAAAAILWAQHTLPSANLKNLNTLSKLEAYVQQVFASGPLPYLLAPFRWMVTPYFAPDARTFFAVVWPALGLMAAHYIWVVRSDVAFEEASLEASKKLAERTAAIRSGNWRLSSRKPRAARAPFTLTPTGFPPIALLWKNLISAGQAFTARIWVSLVGFAVVAVVAFHPAASASPVSAALALFACFVLGWLLLFGPQLVRYDFRQDLLVADALKVLPLPAWQIALGELLAPAAILTGLQWCLLILAVGFCPQEMSAFSTALFAALGKLVGFYPKEMGAFSWPQLIASAAAAAINFPVFNVIALMIPNAAVLLFPAWFQIGKTGPQGIEATGQRLIFFLGQIIVFALTLVPAALASVVVFLLAQYFAGIAVAVLLASLASVIVLGCEAAAGLQLLGKLFERFDLSADLPA